MKIREIESKKDKNILEGTVECPNCHSKDTIASNETALKLLAYSIACFLGLIIAVWIPIIGWLLAPVLFISSIILFISFIVTLLGMNYTLYCKKCNKKFKIKKSDYFKLAKDK